MIKRLVIILVFLFSSISCFAATRTAAAGGGNWGDVGTWEEGAVPTSADDVVIDSGSGNVTINVAASCRSINCTGYTGTLTHNADITLTIAGADGSGNSLILGAGMTYTPNKWNCTVTFTSTVAGNKVTCNGKTLSRVYFSGVGGEWTLQDNFSCTHAFHVQAGSFVTNGNDINCGFFWGLGSSVRSITLGDSVITCSEQSSNGNQMDFSTTNNLTWNVGISTFVISGASTYTANISLKCGGLTYYKVQITGAGSFGISGASTFTELTRTGTAIKTDEIWFSDNQTITGTLNLNGNSSINRLLVRSDTLGTARTLTVTGATVSYSNVDFRDITMTPAKDLSAITGGSGNCGGNTGITFTTATNWYWYNSGAGTYNFSDYSHWYTATNGGGSQMASTRVVLPQDNAYFDADSVTGSTTVDQDMPRICKSLDFTGVDAMNFHMNNVGQTIYGSLTMASNITVTAGQDLIFEGRSAFTLTTSGKSLVSGYKQFIIQMVNGSLTLQDNLTFTTSRDYALYHSFGTFDANDFDVNLGVGGIYENYTSSHTLNMGNGTWTITPYSSSPRCWYFPTSGFTLNEEGSTVIWKNTTFNANWEAGKGETFNNLSIEGGSTNATFTYGNTFNTLTINAPKTVKFTDGTTTTVSSFVATGDASNAITLTGTSTAGWTISDNSGENRVYYCAISYSTATGGATWLAYTSNGNTDGGNNSGWKFTAPSGSVIKIK